MKQRVKRIAIIGPESSGKSELCSHLALHFKTAWIPEYARAYLTGINTSYTIQDIVNIYAYQFKQETEQLAASNNYLFTDTEFLMAKVWCENAFRICPPYIEDMIVKHPYDLYLLTAPDLPWEFDPLRENPGKGDYFFEWYKRLLDEKKLKYGIVSGKGEVRIRSALDIIKNYFPESEHIK